MVGQINIQKLLASQQSKVSSAEFGAKFVHSNTPMNYRYYCALCSPIIYETPSCEFHQNTLEHKSRINIDSEYKNG